jgi:hypothetical protein
MKMYKDKLLEEVKGGLLSGMLPTQTVETLAELPPVAWNGKLMPWTMWCQVISFFREVYRVHKSEAVVRLYYAQKEGWSLGVFPQTVNGAAADEIKDDPDIKTCNKEVRGVQLGTIHSHSSMAAFQSGKDLSDEQAVDGLHITVGKFDEATLDIHSRVMLRRIEFPKPNLLAWIQGPPWVEAIPKACKGALSDWTLTHDIPTVAFSTFWMGRVKEQSFGEFNAAGFGSVWNNPAADSYKHPLGNASMGLFHQVELSTVEQQQVCDLLAPFVRRAYPSSIEDSLSDVLAEVEEAVAAEREMSVTALSASNPRLVSCTACGGSGETPKGDACPACRGFGNVVRETQEPLDRYAN